MDSGVRSVFAVLALSFISTSFSQSIIQLPSENRPFPTPSLLRTRSRRDDYFLYCDSWRFAAETNDAGTWTQFPKKCEGFVQEYMTGDQYRSDSEVSTDYALAFARTVEIAGDGKDAWVFDVDETLLSNVPYYVVHGFGEDNFDGKVFDEWSSLAETPALPASLRLYNELQHMGFKIFLLTGRTEHQRNYTEKNLMFAGYSNYEKLILRGSGDSSTTATEYKSTRRSELEEEGYRIHGCSGDQWSDLVGFAVATRSFKLPNPMYYIA